MCLGVPGRVVERTADVDGLEYGLVEFDGLRRPVCLACVPDAGPGDYVVVHAGLAISRLDEAEAGRLLEALRAIGEGGDEAR
ncbi:MAG: HypC/HybG/HupF family hydrogenase formation chaperone [Gemmataceae bacterium]